MRNRVAFLCVGCGRWRWTHTKSLNHDLDERLAMMFGGGGSRA